MSTVNRVVLLDPKRSYQAIAGELTEACQRVMTSGRYIMGPEVEGFEQAVGKYCNAKHAVVVSSGTDALLVGLMALGIGAGDEVILPTYTFFATAGSVARLGAKPVFVDSCPRCFNMPADAVAKKITKRTKAIIPVHLFGQAAELEPLMALGKSHGLPVIEDGCQAIGAEYRGRRVGGITELGCFSLFPSKNLGGFGDAGLVTTSDDKLAATLRALRSHGEVTRYDHQLLGGNFRIDPLQCALLAVKLKYLDEYTSKRQAHAAHYTKLLVEAGVGALSAAGSACGEACSRVKADKSAPVLLPAAAQSRHVFNQYVIRVAGRRDALRDHLKEKGVDTAVYYPVPLHLQKAFASLKHKAGDFPVSESAAQDSLALPIWAELTTDEVSYVAERIIEFCRR
jgi:dTDP-4-amino-4,6-dideoxygalactose transaminase